MDHAEAQTQLSVLAAADQRPTLDTIRLDVALSKARVRDYLGRWPTDSGYIETWDMNAAAQYAWEIKAGIVAGDFSFTADDASYNKAEVLANIERMVRMYAAKRQGVTTVDNLNATNDYDASGLIP